MPNTSNITRTKAVRIRNEIADYIEGDSNGFREIIESLYERVMRGEIVLKNNEVVVPVSGNGRSIELPEEVYESLKETLEIDEISVEEFVRVVMEAVDSGLIWIEGGKIVVDSAQ